MKQFHKKRTFLQYTGKRLYTLAVLGILGVSAFGSQSAMAFVNAKQDNGFVVNDNWITPAQIHTSGEAEVVRRGVQLPAQYDARNNGWVTPVKDQGSYESCWAFSSIAAIETNLIKNGKASADIDLSENQFAYFFYNREADRLGYTQGDYNKTQRGNYLSAGGTLQGSGIALATWAGVTTEDRSPYLSTPSPDLCYAADYSVKNVYLYDYSLSKLDQSIATVKQAVLDHGAVACGIYMLEKYYNYSNFSYYSPVDGGNHAVTVIGWDDNYSRDNFVSKPPRDGAWIIKNSYGTGFGQNGYNYVSYADASLSEFVGFEAVPQSEQYDNNYQHDGSANPAYSYNKADWYANVFKAKGAGAYNEELKAVGVYTLSTNTRYEVQVYTGLTSAEKPTSGTKAFSSSVKGTLTDAGYQTIQLPEPVSLTAGENFAVLIRVTDANGNNAYVGVDSTYQANWISFIASTNKNQSFVKLDGKWYDLGVKAKANIRMKAYTDVTGVVSQFKLSEKKLGVSKGDSQTLKLKTIANVHRNVTWKSANSKIATVSKNGAVKGKTYGTTNISATFMGGSGKKTLKCKVTVGPPKIKGFKVSGGSRVKVSWKKNSDAGGYEIYYATEKNGTYSKLASVSKKTKTSYSKKLASNTYYIKMRPYTISGKTKLYGSFTAVKQVDIP